MKIFVIILVTVALIYVYISMFISIYRLRKALTSKQEDLIYAHQDNLDLLHELNKVKKEFDKFRDL